MQKLRAFDARLGAGPQQLSPNSSYKGPNGHALDMGVFFKINLLFSMCGACLQVVYNSFNECLNYSLIQDT